jgi:predicted RNA-binding Zn-ribbon protein involved in translation (DUF1610 family)
VTPADKTRIAIECPKCGEKFERTSGSLRRSVKFACPGVACGAQLRYRNGILLTDAEGGRVRTIGSRVVRHRN